VVVRRCLQVSSLIFVLLAGMISSSPWCSERLKEGCWSNVRDAVVVICLIPFLSLCLVAWGIGKRRVWAWFMALLVFAGYVLFGLAGFSGGGNVCLLVLLPFGVVGFIALFARDCRKEFGIR
jgi:hypothetical protein